MKRFFIAFFLCALMMDVCGGQSAFAQAAPAQDSITLTPLVLTGQVGVSYGYNSLAAQGAIFVHFGGPGLTWKYGDWSLGLNVAPSVRIQFGDVVRPTLGFGPSFGYKRWLLTAPIYFDVISGKTTYIPTIGIGYRF